MSSARGSETWIDVGQLCGLRAAWRRSGATVVFTNGCFDLLHPGHVRFLQDARALGDRLVVGINSDASVRAIKGAGRPLVPHDDRAAIVAALGCVDAVTVFEEPTPERLIGELEPDVLVKGGDWPVEQIVGADAVRRRGGRVLSIAFVPGYSTSDLIERIVAGRGAEMDARSASSDEALVSLDETIRTVEHLRSECSEAILRSGRLLADAVLRGGKVLLFGNGGSAAEAEHIAAELVGRFRRERRPLAALALCRDMAGLTAAANDDGFEHAFRRQLEAFARPGDVAIALSTSGASPNVLDAVMAARAKQCIVLGVTGARGTRLASLCDAAVIVPSDVVARIQEASLAIGHLWCELVDARLAEAGEP